MVQFLFEISGQILRIESGIRSDVYGVFFKRKGVVPGTGVEPVRCHHRGILSPVRLPVPPPRQTKMEAPVGFEPTYKGFADPCLTTWPRRLWSGRRDLNPRRLAWEASALPLSYSRLRRYYNNNILFSQIMLRTRQVTLLIGRRN